MILLCHIANAILLALFGPSDVIAVFWIYLHIEITYGGYFLIGQFTIQSVLLVLSISYTPYETQQTVTEKNQRGCWE